MTTPLESVLDTLHGVKTCGGGYQALCPAHEDKQASLSVTEGDGGRVLLHCHAGCDPEAIVEAVGLQLSDLFPKTDTKPRRIVATYDYRNAGGMVDYQAVRYEPKDFRQRRSDGNGGWIPNLDGVQRVIYRLQQVIEAVSRKENVYIVEGEKDVHTLESWGLTATTNAGGAGKWLDSYSEHFAGASVVVLPDNDEPGRNHAQDVAAKLAGTAGSVKIVELPGLAAKQDVSDWVRAGHTAVELLELVYSTPEWTPPDPAEVQTALTGEEDDPEESIDPKRIFPLCDLLTGEVEPVSWTVEPLIPSGGISNAGGDSGTGKSWLMYSLAVSVSAGEPFLGHFPTQQCNVLYFDPENGERLIRRRLKKLHNGLRSEIPNLPTNLPVTVCTFPLRVDNAKQIDSLVGFIKVHGFGLVIADPLIHCLPPGTNENDSVAMARFFESIRYVQAKTGATFLFAHHSRKKSVLGSNDAGQMLRGSSAIRAILDSHIFLRRLRPGVLLAEHDKSRHAECLPSFIIEIKDADPDAVLVTYEGTADESADQTAIATAFIERALADAGGVLTRQQLIDAAKAERLAARTVDRALSEGHKGGTLEKGKNGREVTYALRLQQEFPDE